MFKIRKALTDFIFLGTFFFDLALPGFIPRRGCLRPRQGPRFGTISPVLIGALPVFAWVRPPVTYRRFSHCVFLCMLLIALEPIVFGLLVLPLDAAASPNLPCPLAERVTLGEDSEFFPIPLFLLWLVV